MEYVPLEKIPSVDDLVVSPGPELLTENGRPAEAFLAEQTRILNSLFPGKNLHVEYSDYFKKLQVTDNDALPGTVPMDEWLARQTR